MANPSKQTPIKSTKERELTGYVMRSQTFLTGATMVACSCGEVRVFPNARRDGKCPRGNPWLCMAQLGLPLCTITFEHDKADE